MLEKPSFGEIRKDIINNKKEAESKVDSEESWTQYDSPLWQIGASFEKVLPEKYIGPIHKKLYVEVQEFGHAFKQYIEDTLPKENGKELTAIEFGGPGSKLFADFDPGYFDRSVGVCLDDVRDAKTTRDDFLRKHYVVPSDITDTAQNKILYEILKTRLNTNKVDLIISRMMGGLHTIKKNPAVLERIVGEWYELLNENGIMFAQFEYFYEHNPNMQQRLESEIEKPIERISETMARQWVNAINEKYKDTIDLQMGRGIIRLHKKAGAPDHLPLAKEIL